MLDMTHAFIAGLTQLFTGSTFLLMMIGSRSDSWSASCPAWGDRRRWR